MFTKSYFDFIVDHPEIDRWDLISLRSLSPAGRLLDIGCGAGSFLTLLKDDRHYKGEGIDLNRQAVTLCQKKGLAVRLGNGQKMSFRSATFDIVRAKEVLEHLSHPEELIAEACRVLRPTGLLILHTPTHYSPLYPFVNFWDDYTHIRPFTKIALRRLLGVQGFTIISFQGYTVGRHLLENLITQPLGWIFPFEWRVIAQKT